MAEVKKFGLLRGLKDIYIDEVIVDTEEAYTVAGKSEKLIPAGELKISKSVDKSKTYYDDELYEEIGKEAPSEMELIGAAIRPAFNAWLEGKEIDAKTGAIMDDGDWHSKYFAVSGTKSYTDGTQEHFWFLKCSYGGAEETGKTKDESTDASGMSLPFTAYKTNHKFAATSKACKVMRIDTANTKIKAENKWTDQVVTPDNIADICEKITAAQ